MAELRPPSGEGDGTVPQGSGNGLPLEDHRNRAFDGIPHEGAYKSGGVQNATMNAIERMLKEQFDARTSGN